jgi:hypothetical protein
MRISRLTTICAVGYLKIIYDVCKVTDPALMSILMRLLSYGAVALVIAVLVLFFLYRLWPFSPGSVKSAVV